MTNCPLCGGLVTYRGAVAVECGTVPSCRNYRAAEVAKEEAKPEPSFTGPHYIGHGDFVWRGSDGSVYPATFFYPDTPPGNGTPCP